MKTVSGRCGSAEPRRRACQSRVNELTTRDDHATIYQVGEVGAVRRVAEESANIADQMQEVYEIVDADIENFVHPPEEIKAIYGPSGEGGSTLKQQISNLC